MVGGCLPASGGLTLRVNKELTKEERDDYSHLADKKQVRSVPVSVKGDAVARTIWLTRMMTERSTILLGRWLLSCLPAGRCGVFKVWSCRQAGLGLSGKSF